MNTYILNHVINARTEGSPLLSATFHENSAVALEIAKNYSEYGEKYDIHTFALSVPIYDIIISNNLPNRSKLYEILIWNQVKRDHITYIKSEAPLSADIDEMRSDRSNVGNLPKVLQEPE